MQMLRGVAASLQAHRSAFIAESTAEAMVRPIQPLPTKSSTLWWAFWMVDGSLVVWTDDGRWMNGDGTGTTQKSLVLEQCKLIKSSLYQLKKTKSISCLLHALGKRD
ncbi:hypothetical protein O9993_05890 [Vibrio lentus]|nr:hypothetical protein [Vibrio lentus]